jgi:predicted XRE-type DNA-binding protein
MSMNVFADLGFPNPEEHLAKAKIVHLLDKTIKDKGLTHTEVAELWNLTQPNVASMLRGDFTGYSIDCLLTFANLLNRNIRIVIEVDDAPAAIREEALAA